MAAAIVAVVACVAIGVALASRGGSSSDGTSTAPKDGPNSNGLIVDDEPTTTTPGDDSTSTAPPTEVTGSSTTTPPVIALTPTAATSDAARSAVNLKCTGERATYNAPNLIDGDPNTGWGASAHDGAGQSVTLRFDGPVHLRSIGLTPGFTKVGPRADTGCSSVSAYPYNRWVPRVTYRFDDGKEVTQTFRDDPSMQYVDVDAVTTSVVLTIDATETHPGGDDDTVLSEIGFRGWVGS